MVKRDRESKLRLTSPGKEDWTQSRTAPAPPLPKKKSSHLARSKEVLPKKAALAKGKVEKQEAAFEAQ